eukprot:16155489-Heterocapsa_arctica.AAC.1
MDGGTSSFDAGLLPPPFRSVRALHHRGDFPHMAVGIDECGKASRSCTFDALFPLHLLLTG